MGGVGIVRDHSCVRVPAFITASWYDVILDHDLRHYACMRACAATDEAREQTRLLIGPWSHGMFLNVVGQLDFGRRAMGGSLDLGVDLGTLQTEWFKAQLGGSGSAVLDGPRVRLFVQGVNRWRDEDDWPLARAKPTNWYSAGATAVSRPKRPNTDEGVDTFALRPESSVPDARR